MVDSDIPDVTVAEKLRADFERLLQVLLYLVSLFLGVKNKLKFLRFLFVSLIQSDCIHYNALLKSGKSIQISRRELLHSTWMSFDKSKVDPHQLGTFGTSVVYCRYDESSSTAICTFDAHEFRLRSGTQDELYLSLTQIQSTFIEEKWKVLDCSGKVVFDIGAGIGDTAMYFISKGATRVFAIEPFSSMFALLRVNIELNSLTDLVTSVGRGFGDPVYRVEANDRSPHVGTYYFREGDVMPPLKLNDLVHLAGNKPSVLKVSCVGCERSFLNESDDDLRYFDQIVIEYVYGYKNIEQKLLNAGFRVNCSAPRGIFGRSAPDSSVYLGMIIAGRS